MEYEVKQGYEITRHFKCKKTGERLAITQPVENESIIFKHNQLIHIDSGLNFCYLRFSVSTNKDTDFTVKLDNVKINNKKYWNKEIKNNKWR